MGFCFGFVSMLVCRFVSIACMYCFCFVLCVCFWVCLCVFLYVCLYVLLLLCFMYMLVGMYLLCFVCKFVCNFMYSVLWARGAVGDGLLLWFMCMLVCMFVSIACMYCFCFVLCVCFWVCFCLALLGWGAVVICMYACRVGYVSWAGLLLGGVLL